MHCNSSQDNFASYKRESSSTPYLRTELSLFWETREKSKNKAGTCPSFSSAVRAVGHGEKKRISKKALGGANSYVKLNFEANFLKTSQKYAKLTKWPKKHFSRAEKGSQDV